ncbi:hypothetical protein K1719_043213 [Acacia pycnantha]|nr:hypothetical protein K1719_043213 [Acacia pycnantha]
MATHDNVGRVISHLNKGIEEERYTDAAFLRHKAGAGLVVYLKRGGVAHTSLIASSKISNPAERLSSVESHEGRSELFVASTEDPESGDDKDDGSDQLREFLDSRIGGGEEHEEEKENEAESLEIENAKSDQEGDDDIEINTAPETIGREEKNEIVFKFVIGGLAQKLFSNFSTRKFHRVPAKLENGHDKSTKIRGQRPVDHVIFDLAKFIGREKVSSKVLKDVGELISHTLSQAQNHQPLSGSTIFNRIEIPASSDPLNGLYIGAHGLYSSEVIQLRCKFGQWQEDSGAREPSDLEFYEYVEAFKLIGDPYVPAGQPKLGTMDIQYYRGQSTILNGLG